MWPPHYRMWMGTPWFHRSQGCPCACGPRGLARCDTRPRQKGPIRTLRASWMLVANTHWRFAQALLYSRHLHSHPGKCYYNPHLWVRKQARIAEWSRTLTPVIQTRAVSPPSPHSCVAQHALSPKQGEVTWATFPGDGRTWLDGEAIWGLQRCFPLCGCPARWGPSTIQFSSTEGKRFRCVCFFLWKEKKKLEEKSSVIG